MDIEKLVTSETSSDETDHQEELQDESTSTKRSYECTFCRRGFTNAQALGGHMNIHRKDRLKAKKNTANSSVQSKFSNEESMASPFVSEIRGQPTGYYSIFEAQKNYNMYFQPSVANPRQPSPYGFQYEFLNQRSHQSLNVNQEILGTNLSLRIGSSHLEADNEVRRGIHEEGEVDLELRLGHDPY